MTSAFEIGNLMGRKDGKGCSYWQVRSSRGISRDSQGYVRRVLMEEQELGKRLGRSMHGVSALEKMAVMMQQSQEIDGKKGTVELSWGGVGITGLIWAFVHYL